jgi:hypothetical protein
MIAPVELAEDALGSNIFLDGANRVDRSTWRNYRYETRMIQRREWKNELYCMPIHRDELNRNSLLKQNPDY